MADDLDELRKTLRQLSISLADAIEQAFYAHKLAEKALTAAGKQPDPLGDAHIEDSKRAMLELLSKATERLPK